MKWCLHTPTFALLNYNRITNNKDYGGSHESSLAVLFLLQSRLELTLHPHSLGTELIVRVTNRKRAISHMSPGLEQLDDSCHLQRAASLQPPGSLLHQIRGDICLTVSPHEPGCLLRNLLMARDLTRSLLPKPLQFSSSITSLICKHSNIFFSFFLFRKTDHCMWCSWCAHKYSNYILIKMKM